MTIDVEGAVAKPGVYKLAFGSIINDVIDSSGGLADDADAEYVAKNINLAEKLSDGAKIYIPKVGENEEGTQGQTSSGVSIQQTGLININTASSDMLDSLPGVGPVTAAKIINNRPYQTLNDLLSKKTVSNKVFGEIKDKITVY